LSVYPPFTPLPSMTLPCGRMRFLDTTSTRFNQQNLMRRDM